MHYDHRQYGDNEHRTDCAKCGVSLAPGMGVREYHEGRDAYITTCAQKLACTKRVNAQQRKGGAFGRKRLDP